MLNNEDIAKHRLESLKMAYEFVYKVGKQYKINMPPEINPHDVIPVSVNAAQQTKDDLQDVFNLAGINLNYILNGDYPDELWEENCDE